MARFERSREGSSRRDGRSNGGYNRDRPSRGGYNRDGPNRGGGYNRDGPRRDSGYGGGRRREVEMTKVTCSECGIDCEVPFKPSSSKPVYCNDCFSKNQKSGSSRGSGPSSKDIEEINEKLDKIMVALKIE